MWRRNRSNEPRAAGRRALLLLLLIALTGLMSACGEKSVAKVSTESEAIEIIDVLRENALEVSKEEVGEGATAKWSVVVNEGWFGGGEVARATQVLRYYGLPRADDQSLKDEDSGVFPSPSVENAKRLKEREMDMERKLRMLPSVARVNVSIVLPEDDAIKIDPYPATASVWIVHKDPKPAFNGEQVQHQVAGGVPGLKPERVTVSMLYEPPPPIPQRDLNLRRRNNIILAVGIGLVTVLCFLVGVLLLQIRRQRAELATLREAEETAAESDEEATAAPLPEAEQGRLDNFKSNTGASARQLPAKL